MRNEAASERVTVGSLAELDALVGKHLTAETPRTHWEDSHTHFQFDSVEEAMEALHDPYFRQFVQGEAPPTTVLTEVKEFRRYSTDLLAAWDLIERLTGNADSLAVKREDEHWVAAFGNRRPVIAGTAPVAICLAALRAHGIEVECDLEEIERVSQHHAAFPDAHVKSLYG